jgi:hypothetical protein
MCSVSYHALNSSSSVGGGCINTRRNPLFIAGILN